MRVFLSLLTVLVGLLLTAFLYRQIVVEGEFGPAAILGTAFLLIAFIVLLLMIYLAGTRHKETVRNLLLAFSVSLAAFVLIDFIAGRLLIVPLSPPLVPDQFRHHVLVPDSYAELRQRDFHYVQRVNKLGLRGRETTLEKPDGTKRILMLGDSFTMGKGVDYDETFSAQVEAILAAEMAACGGPSIEVLNGGVDSYAPILSYIQFSRDLLPLAPDIVVLNLDNSDLVQEQAYRQQAVRDQNGEIVAVPQLGRDSIYEKLQSWTARNLYFTRILLVYAIRAMDHKEVSVRRVVNEFGREHFAHTLEGDVDRTKEWQDIFDSVDRIRNQAESIGANFVLSTYPWAHQVNETDWVPGRYTFIEKGERTSTVTRDTIRDYTANLQIELYEALPAFQKSQGSEPLYFQFDPHWTAKGHRAMAEGLARYLAQHHASQWCGTG